MSADLIERFNGLSKALNASLDRLKAAAVKTAQNEQLYREGRAEAWVQVRAKHPDMLAKEREDWVNSHSADLRFLRDLAEGERAAAMEEVRSRRAQISALQTIANVERAEAEFARTGPS